MYTCISDSSAARLDRAGNEILDQCLKLGTADFQVQVLGTRLISSDIGQVDLCLLGRRKFDLGLFSSFFETLQCQDILGQIDTTVFFELFDDVVNDALVKVLAT